MPWQTIVKSRRNQHLVPNLGDYDNECANFSWINARLELDGLPGGGLNIAHEAVDRHAAGPLANHLAIKWLGKDGEIRDYSFSELRRLTNRFANLLQQHEVKKGDTVFVLAGRIPELYIAALGTLKNRSVFCPLFSAFGPEPIRSRMAIGPAPAPLPDVEVISSLTELVASADHLVLAAPATPATHHLLDQRMFAAMKPGAHLVNVARGALIDADALRAALDDGRVACASLDTVDPEPLPEGHWMYSHPRVRLSPHLSWSMPGAAQRLVEPFIDNLRRYRAGEPLTGIVDRAAGY